jgi:aminocarboxymuconate-semialdehyde decarboxylase
VNGRPVGAAELTPFWEAAERLNAAVFVHAVRPAGMDRLVGPKQLQQVLAYPTDVGLAAASAITSNLLLRFPHLRVAFSHGGGTLAMLLPRLEEGRRVFAPVAEAVHETALSQARHMYFDTLVYDERTLRHLLGLFGDDRLIVGTDYPFAFHERRPVERVLTAVADERTRSRILVENARAFLALPE